ncbi:MAG: hypothetical protein COU51_03155 [Parcubacteria group bacterium CG10_big_fil_rev_8_21_14_0_10_36_14]|nr:MAG: hypothetical protein COU51_03155 [Parcubacteria group bacterium CG10_big_fil_rev_8_21_14_0_10_36_14]
MEMPKPSKKEQEAINRASAEHLKRINIELPEGQEEDINDDIPIDIELPSDISRDAASEEYSKRTDRLNEKKIKGSK